MGAQPAVLGEAKQVELLVVHQRHLPGFAYRVEQIGQADAGRNAGSDAWAYQAVGVALKVTAQAGGGIAFIPHQVQAATAPGVGHHQPHMAGLGRLGMQYIGREWSRR
ncbi:hypothetical protein D9M71_260310 [compost metagenome]